MTFTVAVQDQPTQQVTVQPGDQPTTVPFTFPEGTGTRTVTVSVNGEELDREDVPVDCVTEAIPVATFNAVCQTTGGTSVAVHLENTATGTGGHPVLRAIFTLFVNDVAQTVDGASSWSPGAGEVRDLILPLAEDSGTYHFEVRVGRRSFTRDVSTDCLQIDKTADPAEGTPVQAPEAIVYSVKITNSSTEQSATGDVVDILPDGVIVVGTIPDGGVLSADKTRITWADVSLEAGASRTFTFTVRVTAGFGTPVLDNEATWNGNSDHTIHPVQAIDADVIALCDNDVPLYRVTVQSQNLGPLNDQGLPHTRDGRMVPGRRQRSSDHSKRCRRPGVQPRHRRALRRRVYRSSTAVSIPGPRLWKGAAVDADGDSDRLAGLRPGRTASGSRSRAVACAPRRSSRSR